MDSVPCNEFIYCAFHPIGSRSVRGNSSREDWNTEGFRKEIRSVL